MDAKRQEELVEKLKQRREELEGSNAGGSGVVTPECALEIIDVLLETFGARVEPKSEVKAASVDTAATEEPTV